MTKHNNNILRTTLLILGIASFAAGIVYSYGILNKNVADNTIAITEQEEKSGDCMDMNIRQDKDIVEIKAILRYLSEDMAVIKDDMKRQTVILEEIHREVRK